MPGQQDFGRWDWDYQQNRWNIYAHQFLATEWRERITVTRWIDHETGNEIATLLEKREKELPSHYGSILVEQNLTGMLARWYDSFRFAPHSHPMTNELVWTACHIAGSVVMHYKNHYNRTRPYVLNPHLEPPKPITKPGHPAYPSGHSTQMHLVAHVVEHLGLGDSGKHWEIAGDVAANRERAGLHYPSDSEAGKKLARSIFEILVKCPAFADGLIQAKGEWSTGGPTS